MGEWQPIETAPKTGEEIILAHGNFVWIDSWQTDEGLENGGYWEECETWTTPQVPSHWMPLPEPPADNNVSVALTGVSAKAEVGSVLATRNYNTDTWNNKVPCATCGNPADFEEHARGQAAEFHRFNPAPLSDPPKNNV